MEINNIVYINLEHRVDRRESFESEMMRCGFKAERFEAFSINSDIKTFPIEINENEFKKDKCHSARICCTMSHYQVIKNAKDKGYDHILVCEDDAVFCDNFINLLNGYVDIIRENHLPCDMFYTFGVLHSYPIIVPGKIRKLDINVSKCYGGGCYLVFEHFYDTILTQISSVHDVHKVIDWQYVELQEKGFEFLFPIKSMTTQMNGYSDIDMKYKNMDYMFKDGWYI